LEILINGEFHNLSCKFKPTNSKFLKYTEASLNANPIIAFRHFFTMNAKIPPLRKIKKMFNNFQLLFFTYFDQFLKKFEIKKIFWMKFSNFPIREIFIGINGVSVYIQSD
jgi:hypothetical protein